MLLPGGSRMEGFEVDRRSTSRQRRTAVFVLCLVSAGACLATVHLSRGIEAPGADELVAVVSNQAVKATAQLRQKPLDKADAYLQKHGVPSWLSTGSVQLKPLQAMIHEQLAVKEMRQAAANKKIAKQEAKAEDNSAVSPHELAMKNALHSQAVKKVSAKSADVVAKAKAHLTQALKQTSSPVNSDDTASAPAAAKPGYYRGAIRDAQADLDKMRKGEHEAELVIETKEEKKLEVIRKEEEIVNKEEVHRLANIKKAAMKQESDMRKQISELKHAKAAEQLSERKTIRTEMAKIKDEERAKLAALKKKMTVIAKGGVLDAGSAPAAKPAAEADAAAVKPSASVADSAAATTARGHTVVQKPAVQVQSDTEKADDEGGATAVKAVKAPKSSLAVKKDSRSDCTTTKCDLSVEDKQWNVIGGKVDDYAKEAERAHGKAKREALAHMQYLQKQIERDYKHVTGFAVAQEHALPPAPKME